MLVTKQNLKVSKSTYKHLTFSAAKTGYVTARSFIEGINTVFKLYKGGEGSLPTEKVYNGKVSIKQKKLQDVTKIVHYIPDEYREFYQNIFKWLTETTFRAEDDDSRVMAQNPS